MRKRSRISLLVLVYGLSAPFSAFLASSASAVVRQEVIRNVRLPTVVMAETSGRQAESSLCDITQ